MSDPPGERRSETLILTDVSEALARGHAIDLDVMHARFEAARDATDDPAALFELAVDEARAIDRVVHRHEPTSDERRMLADALAFVLGGTNDGVEPRGLHWALGRARALLGTRDESALDDETAVLLGCAATTAMHRTGALAGARDAIALALVRARRLDPDAREMALELAFALAVEADDLTAAHALANERVEVLRTVSQGGATEALAEALSELHGLAMAIGEEKTAANAITELLATVRELGARGHDPEGRRLRRALLERVETLATCEGASGLVDAIDELVAACEAFAARRVNAIDASTRSAVGETFATVASALRLRLEHMADDDPARGGYVQRIAVAAERAAALGEAAALDFVPPLD